MNIRLRYALTGEDYAEFMRAYLKNARALTPRELRGWRSPVVKFRWMLMATLVVFAIVMFSLPSEPPNPTAPAVPAWVALMPLEVGAAFGVVFVGLAIVVQRSGYIYRRLAPLIIRVGEMKEMVMTETRLTTRERGMVSEMEWGYFIKFVEMPRVFVLFFMPRQGVIVPKRGFGSEGEMEEFRRFALARVGREVVGFPVEGVGRKNQSGSGGA